jgi:hypothetical protein
MERKTPAQAALRLTCAEIASLAPSASEWRWSGVFLPRRQSEDASLTKKGAGKVAGAFWLKL